MTKHLETLALHGGNYRADPTTGAVAVPIYQTTSYQFHDTAHAIRMFSLQEFGFTYTRTGNPTRDTAERRIAAIEGGAGSLIVSSGAAARLYSLLNIAEAGDNVVAALGDLDAKNLGLQLKRFGIELRVAEDRSPDSFARASDGRTRAYFGESLDLETGALLEIAPLAATGCAQGIPLIIDNSLLPTVARPIDEGAAIVVYRGDGFLSGSAANQSGAIVDGGKFPWRGDRSPVLTEPDASYHGAIWTDVAAHFKVPLAYLIRARMRFLRDFGGAVSPYEVFALIQGIETLPLRMRRQTEAAAALFEHLYSLAPVQNADHLGRGTSPLVRFRLTDGPTARTFLDGLRLIGTGPGLGDRRSAATLVNEGTTIILSAGLENPEDLKDDLTQAAAVALSQ